MPRRLGWIPAVIAILVSLLPLPLTPASASPGQSIQQAYTAGRIPELPPAGATTDFYFHGEPTDEADKYNFQNSATFDANAPGDVLGTAQLTHPIPTLDWPVVPFAAFWSGPFTGDIAGQAEFRWYWSTRQQTNALVPIYVEVTLYADPDPAATFQPEKVIARQDVALQAGPLPTLNINRIAVEGVVNERLLIQVRPLVLDHNDLTIHYDSANHPSGFGVDRSGDAPPLPTSSPVEYTGEPLALQTSYVGRDSFEPTLGVDAEGTAFYASGAFDAGFGLLGRTEVLRSSDGGTTWESVQPPLPSELQSEPPTTLDPYVYVDGDTGRVFNIELYVGCSYLLYSDTKGESWSRNPAACGSFVNDHQTLVTGPPPAGLTTLGYPEVVYYCFNRVLDASCGRSLDGGTTFTPTGTPAFFGEDPAAGGNCGGLHGHITTDSVGRLFVPKGHCGFPWVSISDDGGTTWKRVQVSDELRTAGIQTAIAADSADNLYYVWWDTTWRLPWMSVSTDHGATWGEPMMVAPPGVREVNFPVVTAGDSGRVALTFPGTTDPRRGSATRPWNSYVVVTTNALDADPTFVSTTANDPADPIHRGACQTRCAGMFDFIDIDISHADGSIWASATDTCTGSCVSGLGGAGDAEGIAIRQLTGPWLWDRDPELIPTQLAVTTAGSGDYSDETTWTAALSEVGGQAVDGPLTFELLGTSTSRTTGTTGGSAQVSLILEDPPGSYTLRVSYPGDGDHASTFTDVPFVIDHEDTSISLEVHGKGAKRTLVATLVDDAGAGLGSKLITFLIDGEMVGSASTLSSGKADFSPEGKYPGHRVFRAEFRGDEWYRQSWAEIAT